MATLVVYGSTADSHVQSSDPTYLTCRSGSALSVLAANSLLMDVGQGTGFIVWEGFISFLTSALGAEVARSAILNMQRRVTDRTGGQVFDINVRLKDWSTAVDTGDWVAGASLSGLTLLAHQLASSFPANTAWDFVSDALAANINGSGSTRMILSSSRHEAGSVPSGDEYVEFHTSDEVGTTQDPSLTIIYGPFVAGPVDFDDFPKPLLRTA